MDYFFTTNSKFFFKTFRGPKKLITIIVIIGNNQCPKKLTGKVEHEPHKIPDPKNNELPHKPKPKQFPEKNLSIFHFQFTISISNPSKKIKSS
jgi:hypothetical protein